jgi:hypothetical protein
VIDSVIEPVAMPARRKRVSQIGLPMQRFVVPLPFTPPCLFVGHRTQNEISEEIFE